MKSKGWGVALFVVLLLALDQALKIWIKTHLQLGESIVITSWFHLYFTENPGMAFGLEIFNKLFLTLFRMGAVVFIAIYLYKIIKKNFKFGYLLCISLIFAGAIGNIIDSIFYGKIFNESPVFTPNMEHLTAVLFPPDGGYGTWLHGRVVDMLYFPLINVTLPEWVPFWGSEPFIFFRPIFNLADSAICVGVFILFIFYRATLSRSLSKEKKEDAEETTV